MPPLVAGLKPQTARCAGTHVAGRQASVYSGFGGDDAADADADAKLAVDSDPEGYVDEHGNRSGAHAGSKPERKASATSFCFEADCDDDFDVGLGNMASFDGGAQAGAGILHSFSSVQKYQGHGPRKMSSVLVHDNVAETAEHISKIYDGVPNASKTAVEKLGEGATANVYNLQHRKTKVNYACKLINLAAVGSQEKKDLLLREIPMLQELDHPNIIKSMPAPPPPPPPTPLPPLLPAPSLCALPPSLVCRFSRSAP